MIKKNRKYQKTDNFEQYVEIDFLEQKKINRIFDQM